MRAHNFKDEVGVKYGRLIVKAMSKNVSGKTTCECLCECGKMCVVLSSNLRTGNTQSCGCLSSENVKRMNLTHGHSAHGKVSKTYAIWRGVSSRIDNPLRKDYSHVSLCDRWFKFENFLSDMGEVPPGKSLDRINPFGDYEPNNCRWATMKEQQNNRTNNFRITINNQTKTLAQWCDLQKLGYAKVWARINKLGWNSRKALDM